MRPMNRKLSAAAFATAFAFAGVACDDEEGNVGDEVEDVGNEVEEEVPGGGE